MAAKVPIRAVFDGSTATGLAEYQTDEFIALAYGGLGASLSIGSAGQVLKVNSGASALEFGNVEAVLNIDGMTNGSSATIADSDKFAISDGGTEKYVLASQIKTYASSSDPSSADGDSLGTASLEWSDLYLADGGIIYFGNDQDVTLTHVADTGILLNGTMAIQFNDSSQYINAPSNTILDINATDEIELNATLLDVNANLDVSGTGTIAGAVTTAALTASGILKTDDTTEATSTTDGSLQTDGGLSVAKDVVAGDDVKLLSDSAVLSFGADSEVTLTHVHNDGLLLNSDNQLQFRDSAINIRSDADGDLDINADDEIELNSTLIDINGNLDVSGTIVGASTLSATTITASTAFVPDASDGASLGTTSLEFSNLYLADSASIYFGDDQDITLTHSPDTGLTTKGTFQATTITATTAVVPDASDGAALGTTSLEWSDLYLADGAIIYFGDDQDITLTHSADTGLTTNGTFQATTITATTAVVPDASDGAALGTTSLEWSDLYLADGAVIGFGDDQDVTLTHVADAGLLLNSSMYLTFRDSALKISSSADGQLDIDADTEVEITATTVDLNGNLDVSGTYTGGGLMTTGGNIVIPNSGNIGSVGDTDSLAIDSSGNVTASQNLTVTGNFTVNGTTTTVSTTNMVVEDNMIELNNGAGSNANDSGIVIERGSTGDNAIIHWDESADKFQVGTTTATGSSTGNLTVTTGTLVANVEGSGAGLTAGTTPLTTLDIDGGTDIGADLTTSDLIIIDDGAGGTNRKAALSRINTLVQTAGGFPLTALDIDGGTDINAALTASDLIIVDDGAGGTNRKAPLSRVTTLTDASATALAIALG